MWDRAWKTAVFCIGDAAMDHSHTRGSDFEISSKDQTDVVDNITFITHHIPVHIHMHTYTCKYTYTCTNTDIHI